MLAKHISWGNRKPESRGIKLLDFMDENEFVCINQPELGPTYSKSVNNKESISYIDLAFVNRKLHNDDIDCSLDDNAICTEHLAIKIVICNNLIGNKITSFVRTEIDYKRTNWKKFISIYKNKAP